MAEDKGGCYTLDMRKFMSLMAEGKRWKDLQDNSTYAVNKSILISSTDVRKSNSAARYLALASFVANDNNVVERRKSLACFRLCSSCFSNKAS
jgi:hypothetical protein